MAEWKEVPGTDGYYMASTDGVIVSTDYRHTKKVKPLSIAHQHGYAIVHLKHGTKFGNFKVHRIIAETFIPNPDNLPFINHKDENKLNNNVSNLEWCTSKYNANYGTRNERISKANSQKNVWSKAVIKIDADGTKTFYPSQIAAAKANGVHQGDVSNCCHKRQKAINGIKFEFA